MGFAAGDILRFEGSSLLHLPFWRMDDFKIHRTLERFELFFVLSSPNLMFKAVDSSGVSGWLLFSNSEAYWKVIKP